MVTINLGRSRCFRSCSLEFAHQLSGRDLNISKAVLRAVTAQEFSVNTMEARESIPPEFTAQA